MSRYSSPRSLLPLPEPEAAKTEPTPTIPAIKSVEERQAIRAQAGPWKGGPPMLDNRLVEDSVWLRRLLRGVAEMQDEDNRRVLRLEGRLARVRGRENWRNYARDLERKVEDLQRK
jgi:hypothetical protein